MVQRNIIYMAPGRYRSRPICALQNKHRSRQRTADRGTGAAITAKARRFSRAVRAAEERMLAGGDEDWLILLYRVCAIPFSRPSTALDFPEKKSSRLWMEILDKESTVF
jgi:hypothetical protein